MGFSVLRAGRLGGGRGTPQIADYLSPPCDGCQYFNLLDFGGDPTGSADSTAGFLAAALGTPLNARIYMPTTAGGSATYLIDPEAINWQGRQWIGYLLDPSQKVTLKANSAGGAGDALIHTTSPARFYNFYVDGAGYVDYGFHMDFGSGTRLKNIVIENTNVYGAFCDIGASDLELVACRNNTGAGFGLASPNASFFYNCTSENNAGLGIHHFVSGGQSGALSWFGGAVLNNGSSEEILLDGIEGSLYSGTLVAGSENGVRLTNRVRNVIFSGLSLSGPETNFAFVVDDLCLLSTVAGCYATGVDYRRVNVHPGATNIQVVAGGNADDYGTLGRMKYFVDDATTPFLADISAQGAHISSAPPAAGFWRSGSVVWNNAPGSTSGWRCTASGTPGTWVAF